MITGSYRYVTITAVIMAYDVSYAFFSAFYRMMKYSKRFSFGCHPNQSNRWLTVGAKATRGGSCATKLTKCKRLGRKRKDIWKTLTKHEIYYIINLCTKIILFYLRSR